MNFIPVLFYYDIYLIFVLMFSIGIIPRYSRLDPSQIRPNNHKINASELLILVFITLYIGLRPISEAFADMTQYFGIYNRWSGPFEFDFDAENIIYDNLLYYFASIHFPPILFYLLIATVYFGCTQVACKKFFPNDTNVAFVVFLAAFSTFSYGTNGIKAGAATAVFLLALAYRDKLWLAVTFSLISLGIHHAMQLPVAAYVLTLLYKNSKFYFVVWCVCLLMAILHVTAFQNLFAGFSDERGAGYLSTDASEWGGKSGLRLDFIGYSAMPVLVGYYALYKKKMHLSKFYSNLLNMYLVTNGVWMLCMYANYTNRIAYLSWFMYPIVLIYPYLNEDWGANRYKTFSKVSFAHLGFTLFMHFIYYA